MTDFDVKHVRIGRSGKVHYWGVRPYYERVDGEMVRREVDERLCWTHGGGFRTAEATETSDPVDCKLCLARYAARQRQRPISAGETL